MHSEPPLGQDQNQPYSFFSMASRKCLHTMSVLWFGFSLPCFCLRYYYIIVI